MSKTSEVEQVIRELRDAASLLNDTANWLYGFFSADKVQEHNADLAETQKQPKKQLIRGEWGNGEERKERLTNAGYDYSEVQRKVNEKLK